MGRSCLRVQKAELKASTRSLSLVAWAVRYLMLALRRLRFSSRLNFRCSLLLNVAPAGDGVGVVDAAAAGGGTSLLLLLFLQLCAVVFRGAIFLLFVDGLGKPVDSGVSGEGDLEGERKLKGWKHY